MIEVKPVFYDKFQCIADKCPQTCCQGWKISVDDETYSKWKVRSLSDKNNSRLTNFVKRKDGQRVMRLVEDEKCPFLAETGLCKLVLQFGDQILSRTCDTFPRQVHRFEDRVEYSLVTCCPVVIDLMRECGRIEWNEPVETKDSLFEVRKILLNILQREDISLETAMLAAFYLMMEFYEERMVVRMPEESELDELIKGIGRMEISVGESLAERNELFLDIVENYRREGLYKDILKETAKLAEVYEAEKSMREWERFGQTFSAYEGLMRKFVVMEVYTNLLIPGSDLESMMVMFQWTAMEYAVLKHMLFLRWRLEGEQELSYEQVRRHMVASARMMGYDEADIYEYMENCFQDIIWEWGYMALLLGK